MRKYYVQLTDEDDVVSFGTVTAANPKAAIRMIKERVLERIRLEDGDEIDPNSVLFHVQCCLEINGTCKPRMVDGGHPSECSGCNVTED